MEHINNLLLIGLPGSGKSRVYRALEYLLPVECSVRESIGFDFSIRDNEQAWLIWDAREGFDYYDPEWLRAFFSQSHVLVVNFWTALDLTQQSMFKRQLKQWFSGSLCYADMLDKPMLQRALMSKFSGPIFLAPGEGLTQFTCHLGRVVLDHLLFVLDRVQQQYANPIWRGEGVFNTLEYANPVKLEMSRAQLHSYGVQATHNQLTSPSITGLGELKLWISQDINLAELNEWLVASLAPGEVISI